MGRSVNLEHKVADLSTQFGLEWATKLFGAEAIASLPVRQAGKNKGAPKGFIIWRKALESGYCRECCSPVRAGQLVDAWIGVGYYSARSDAVCGNWLGRVQPMGCSASAGYFFEDGRARHAAEQARQRADEAERNAEFDRMLREARS